MPEMIGWIPVIFLSQGRCQSLSLDSGLMAMIMSAMERRFQNRFEVCRNLRLHSTTGKLTFSFTTSCIAHFAIHLSSTRFLDT